MAQAMLIAGTDRRRRWPEEEKLEILVEAVAPGASPSDVARRREISTGLHMAQEGDGAGRARSWSRTQSRFFLPAVVVEPAPARACDKPAPIIEIQLKRGVKVRIEAGMPEALITATLRRCSDPSRSDVKVWVAAGRTDMRKGTLGLALLVREGLRRDPHAGDLFIFCGRAGDLDKILWHDGLGVSLYAKRLDRGRFIWPAAKDGAVTITASQMAYSPAVSAWSAPSLRRRYAAPRRRIGGLDASAASERPRLRERSRSPDWRRRTQPRGQATADRSRRC